ncbi:MAG: carbonic anhydrase [Candidatus Odinarchaeum yellowstonii]|uniref:carbonic anhydrase n=1 Tax=Odinarchaeota yellowstonii (strain LCB_4) TaxID=1841599 RepID=A0AAF0IDY9_ODILC|nr:MAG: carbonic anhydrase [Candidatus Odinarchaeum yellowstonii]
MGSLRIEPYTILNDLLEGNKRYIEGRRLNDISATRRLSVAGEQSPIATVLGCSDSRVPPEHIFDKGLGELFVVRTAGHVIGELEIGSLEYACEHLKTPLLLVLGHTGCGAVKASLKNSGGNGYLNHVIKTIKPIVAEVLKEHPALTQEALVNRVVVHHIQSTVNKIMERSEIIKKLVKEKYLVVKGSLYDLETGKITLLD